MKDLLATIDLYDDDTPGMADGGRIPFDNGGEVEKFADEFVKQEKNKLISAKDESQWFKIIDEIKLIRNGLYPNDLAREVLAIYDNKFPVNNYPEFEQSKESKMKVSD